MQTELCFLSVVSVLLEHNGQFAFLPVIDSHEILYEKIRIPEIYRFI